MISRLIVIEQDENFLALPNVEQILSNLSAL